MSKFDSGSDFHNDDWLRPPASKETKQKSRRDLDTRAQEKRPRRETPPPISQGNLDGFRLKTLLGVGSHGWVFEAVEEGSNRTLAMKILSDPASVNTLRAKNGFRRMSKLRHNGLIQLHQIHETDEYVGFSMEKICGPNLIELRETWKRKPVAEACDDLMEMVRQITSALAWMHARNVLHRDIKPSNLMLHEEDHRFVLIDYDLAGCYDPEGDPGGHRSYLLFTPRYVAPEVLVQQSYVPASDIFSLGMVVLESLRIFSFAHGDDQAAAIRRDEDDQVNDQRIIAHALTGLHSDIPTQLIEAVTEMLSANPSDRPMAMSLSRLGLPLPTPTTIRQPVDNIDRWWRSITAARQNELQTLRRWTHLILGGQVQRLHIEGPSGIGKSVFLGCGLNEVRRQPWPQVFSAVCQRREQRPLQAFSQITDEIVTRFRRRDREPLLVDMVTESIVRRALPGFALVLRADPSEPCLITSPLRPGALEAADKVCRELRKLGPVFFVIDDSHWADQDTLNVLDHLSSAGKQCSAADQSLQGLGIVTVSRCGGDRQRLPADTVLKLEALSDEVVLDVLRDESCRYGLEFSDSFLHELVKEIQGLPYRLDAYLSEMQPGGVFHSQEAVASVRPDLPRRPIGERRSSLSPHLSIDAVPPIEKIWQARGQRLPEEARDLLLRIAMAGRAVHLSELADEAEESLTLHSQLEDLQRQHLIHREGIDGQTVRIWHDRLAQQWIAATPPERLAALHRCWAVSLQKRPDASSAEIADHYDQAGDGRQFLIWARKAAEDALNLFAHGEAARWYRSVADRAEGRTRQEALRSAADAYVRGGRLTEGARTYHELATMAAEASRLPFELMELQCWFRAGRFEELKHRIPQLMSRLHLPKVKPKWLALLTIASRAAILRIRPTDLANLQPHASRDESRLTADRILAVLRVLRPLSFYDNCYAADLMLYIKGLARGRGRSPEQVELAVAEATFLGYEAGRGRQRAYQMLERLREQVIGKDDPESQGTVHSGFGYAAALAGEWNKVAPHFHAAEQAYHLSDRFQGLEIAHNFYAEAVALFQTGQTELLRERTRELRCEGTTSTDHFMLTLSTLGHASAAFLANDAVDELKEARKQLTRKLDSTWNRCFSYFIQTNLTLESLYRRDAYRASSLIESLNREFKTFAVKRIQIQRILAREMQCLLLMQLLTISPQKTPLSIARLIRHIRSERIPFAVMKADLLEGLVRHRHPESWRQRPGRLGRHFRSDASGRTSKRSPEAAKDQIIKKLESARRMAEETGCVPTALLAADEIDSVRDDHPGDRLLQFLSRQGVKDPVRFARLYGGAQ